MTPELNSFQTLPLTCIWVIMKCFPEVSSINQEAPVLTAKATLVFVQYLATYFSVVAVEKKRKRLLARIHQIPQRSQELRGFLQIYYQRRF